MSLPSLLCGSADGTSDLSKVLQHAASNLDTLQEQISWLSNQTNAHYVLFGPFVGRSLLELSLTVLLARLDPFRALLIRKMQLHPDYAITRRARLSLQWQDDFVATTSNRDLWSPDLSQDKISRAILGDYADHLFWRPALTNIQDANLTGGGAWYQELLLIESDSFILQMRSRVQQAFSAFSKGVHHEFLSPSEQYDRQTIHTLLLDTLKTVCHLGFVSHGVSHSPGCLNLREAMIAYEKAQKIGEV